MSSINSIIPIDVTKPSVGATSASPLFHQASMTGDGLIPNLQAIHSELPIAFLRTGSAYCGTLEDIQVYKLPVLSNSLPKENPYLMLVNTVKHSSDGSGFFRKLC